jgi:hypothetical protein
MTRTRRVCISPGTTSPMRAHGRSVQFLASVQPCRWVTVGAPTQVVRASASAG